jgi:hypothetical protein
MLLGRRERGRGRVTLLQTTQSGVSILIGVGTSFPAHFSNLSMCGSAKGFGTRFGFPPCRESDPYREKKFVELLLAPDGRRVTGVRGLCEEGGRKVGPYRAKHVQQFGKFGQVDRGADHRVTGELGLLLGATPPPTAGAIGDILGILRDLREPFAKCG